MRRLLITMMAGVGCVAQAADGAPTPAPAPSPAPMASTPVSTPASTSSTTPAAAHPESPLSLDFRMRFGGAPGVKSVSGGSASGSYDQTMGIVWGVQGVLRHRLSPAFGYLLSVGFFGSGHGTSQRDSDELGSFYAAAGAELGAGIFWQFAPRLHAELMPFYQIGKGRMYIDPDGLDIRGDNGLFNSWGCDATCLYTFRFGLQVGGFLGYQDFVGTSEFGSVDVEASGNGLRVGGLVGYSF